MSRPEHDLRRDRDSQVSSARPDREAGDDSNPTWDAVALRPGPSAEEAADEFAERAAGDDTAADLVDRPGVRLHHDAASSRLAADHEARAVTIGQDVHFGAGEYRPETPAGRALIAHEVGHAAGQAAAGVAVAQRKPIDPEIEKELDAELKAEGISGNDPYDLQGYAYKITHDPASMSLLPKPDDKAAAKTWARNLTKAYALALRILAGKHADREARAGLIGMDLATVGFVEEALDVGSKLTKKESAGDVIRTEVLGHAAKLTEAQITELVRWSAVEDKKSAGSHPILRKLVDSKGAFSGALGTAKSLAAVKALWAAYAKADLYEPLAELLVWDRALREPVATWLWSVDKAYLFSILEHTYFVEPGYHDPSDKVPKILTMKDDMPWVYKWKQKYYVDFLIAQAATVNVTLPPPTDMTFRPLRTWLEANTEKIAQAMAQVHPKDPEAVAAIYEHLADIFFFHVDRGDVTADPAGKVGRLPEADPARMRLKADCDVLATYAMRFLAAGGFTPVGYLAIMPAGNVGHAVALLEQGGTYYIVNNKEVDAAAAANLTDAIVELRDSALQIYKQPPASYEAYYAAAEAGGAMPAAVASQDASARRKDLE